MLFQHTAARRRLQLVHYKLERCELFQHTAAWRRLPVAKSVNQLKGMVSTHSRVEAAARGFNALAIRYYCFNTQPRGGGCYPKALAADLIALFQHTAAWRRLRSNTLIVFGDIEFQHTAAWRRLPSAFLAPSSDT